MHIIRRIRSAVPVHPPARCSLCHATPPVPLCLSRRITAYLSAPRWRKFPRDDGRRGLLEIARLAHLSLGGFIPEVGRGGLRCWMIGLNIRDKFHCRGCLLRGGLRCTLNENFEGLFVWQGWVRLRKMDSWEIIDDEDGCLTELWVSWRARG